MNDYLPIEQAVIQSDLKLAAELNLSPAAREPAPRRTILRPSILKTSLPSKKPNSRIWPKWIGDCQGSQFYRFEDQSVTWTGTAHRLIGGAPNAYHPLNQNALGSIAEQQARGFTGLVSQNNILIRQCQSDPVPGHLVSRTAYQHQAYHPTDPRRYLNANVVPYLSIPLSVVLNWKDEWGMFLGSAAAIWDRCRGYRFMAVVGEVDLHGCGGISKCIWDQMGMGHNDSSWNTIEFHVFTGKAHEGYELQRWTLPPA